MPLLAPQFPRTYLDVNRHPGDIDLALLDGPWPHDHVPSGKAQLGKALLWRTLHDGRALYDRRLSVAEVVHRIEQHHRLYHAQLKALLDAAHARFGVVFHINCHSMSAFGGAMGEGRAGLPRADIVLGDRGGTTCAPQFTVFVRGLVLVQGYSVKVNDPFKGAELVRAYADPAAGRHSLQLEVNKRPNMENGQIASNGAQIFAKSAGFAPLQAHLMHLIDAIDTRFNPVDCS